MRAASELLEALGVDLATEATVETPRRMVDVYAELLDAATGSCPPPFPTTASTTSSSSPGESRSTRSASTTCCRSSGVAPIGYLPGERIIGLSKLARVVDLFARSLQVQERLTTDIARWLERELAPRGLGVVIEAEHMCMSLRGVQKPGATTVTSALVGQVRDDARTRQEFLALAGGPSHG